MTTLFLLLFFTLNYTQSCDTPLIMVDSTNDTLVECYVLYDDTTEDLTRTGVNVEWVDTLAPGTSRPLITIESTWYITQLFSGPIELQELYQGHPIKARRVRFQQDPNSALPGQGEALIQYGFMFNEEDQPL